MTAETIEHDMPAPIDRSQDSIPAPRDGEGQRLAGESAVDRPLIEREKKTMDDLVTPGVARLVIGGDALDPTSEVTAEQMESLETRTVDDLPAESLNHLAAKNSEEFWKEKNKGKKRLEHYRHMRFRKKDVIKDNRKEWAENFSSWLKTVDSESELHKGLKQLGIAPKEDHSNLAEQVETFRKEYFNGTRDSNKFLRNLTRDCTSLTEAKQRIEASTDLFRLFGVKIEGKNKSIAVNKLVEEYAGAYLAVDSDKVKLQEVKEARTKKITEEAKKPVGQDPNDELRLAFIELHSTNKKQQVLHQEQEAKDAAGHEADDSLKAEVEQKMNADVPEGLLRNIRNAEDHLRAKYLTQNPDEAAIKAYNETLLEEKRRLIADVLGTDPTKITEKILKEQLEKYTITFSSPEDFAQALEFAHVGSQEREDLFGHETAHYKALKAMQEHASEDSPLKQLDPVITLSFGKEGDKKTHYATTHWRNVDLSRDQQEMIYSAPGIDYTDQRETSLTQRDMSTHDLIALGFKDEEIDLITTEVKARLQDQSDPDIQAAIETFIKNYTEEQDIDIHNGNDPKVKNAQRRLGYLATKYIKEHGMGTLTADVLQNPEFLHFPTFT